MDYATNDNIKNGSVSGFGSIVRAVDAGGTKAGRIRNKGNDTAVTYPVSASGKYIFIQSKVMLHDNLSDKVAIRVMDSAKKTFDLITFSTNGSIMTSAGIRAGSYKARTWYTVTVKLNTATKMYDVYLDGRPVLYRVDNSAMANLTSVAFASFGTSGAETMFTVDHFRVYSGDSLLEESAFPVKNYNTKVIKVTDDEVKDGVEPPKLLMETDFNEVSVGARPNGTGAKGAPVGVVPDATDSANQYLCVDRSDPERGDMYFEVSLNQQGVQNMVIEADFNVSPLAVDAQLFQLRSPEGQFVTAAKISSNGTISPIGGTAVSGKNAKGNWVNIAAAFHFGSKTFDLYVDKELAAKDVAFSNMSFPEDIQLCRFTIPLGGASVLNIDNLKVYTAAELITDFSIFNNGEEDEEQQGGQEQRKGVMQNVPAIKADLTQFETIPAYQPAVETTYIPNFDGAKEKFKDALCFIIDNNALWVQGERYKMPYKPFLENSIMYVPAKHLGAALGMPVSWEEASRSVKIGEITIKENESKLTAQGKEVKMRTPMKLIDGVSYVPIQEVVSDAMGKYFFQSFKGMAFVADGDLGLKDSSDTNVDDKVKLMNYVVFDRPKIGRAHV